MTFSAQMKAKQMRIQVITVKKTLILLRQILKANQNLHIITFTVKYKLLRVRFMLQMKRMQAK